MERDEFFGKVALVTGGGSGIGRATAAMFARRGAQVVISDVSAEAGQSAVSQLKEVGGEAVFVKVDVSRFEECERLVDQALDAFGRLDCAVNNAGIVGKFGQIAEYSVNEWNRVIAVNLTGVFNCLSQELKAMKASGGTIVNMSSILGLVGGPGASAYCAAKHGVIGLTKSAALENGRYKIRVNAVCPGFVQTQMVDDNPRVSDSIRRAAIRRLADADEIAETVLWLCSAKSSFVTGAAFQVDGGAISG